MMQSIGASNREMLRAATVTIDAVDGAGVYQQSRTGEGQYQENVEMRREGTTTKRVHFADHPGGVYVRGVKQVED